jgi:hypothetical protein
MEAHHGCTRASPKVRKDCGPSFWLPSLLSLPWSVWGSISTTWNPAQQIRRARRTTLKSHRLAEGVAGSNDKVHEPLKADKAAL